MKSFAYLHLKISNRINGNVLRRQHESMNHLSRKPRPCITSRLLLPRPPACVIRPIGFRVFAISSSFSLPGIIFNEDVSVMPACIRFVFIPIGPNSTAIYFARLSSDAFGYGNGSISLPIFMSPFAGKADNTGVRVKKFSLQQRLLSNQANCLTWHRW